MGKTESMIKWEDAKGKIFLRLANYEAGKRELEERAYVPFLDLAILFYCPQDKSGSEGFYVNKEHLCAWNQSVSDILQAARENTFHKDNMLMEPIGDFLSRGAVYGISYGAGVEMPPTIIFTNKSNFFGAAMMLNTSELKKLADCLGSDLYLLPSSVHEILAVCPQPDMDIFYFTDMVKEMNCYVLGPGEYLSDHAYYFDREKCEVRMTAPA